MKKLTENDLHKMGLRTNKEMLKQVQHDGSSEQHDNTDRHPELVSKALLIQNFRYKYKTGYLALNIPQMQIPVGQITAITGNNGDGKTTFLNCLCGLGHRSKGTIEFKGKTYKRKNSILTLKNFVEATLKKHISKDIEVIQV